MPDEHPTTIGLVQSALERVIACLDDILLLDHMEWVEQVLLTLEQVLQFKDPEATPSDEQIAQHFDRVFENGWSTNLPIPRPPKIRDITFDDLKVYIGNFNCNLPADGDRDSKPEASPPPHRREGARAFAMAGQFEIEDDSGAKRIGITEFVTDSQGEWVDPCFLLIGIGPAYEHKFKREALLKWKKVVLDRIDTWNRDLAVFKTRKSIYELVGRDPEYQPEEEVEKLDQVSSEKNIPPPPARPPPPLPRSPIGLAHKIMRRKEKSLTFFASERCICCWVEELVKEHERGFQHAIHDMQGRFQ